MLFTIGWLALASIGAHGQTPAPPAPISEHVVVTATAAPVDTGSLGRELTLISREQLERLPIGSVEDALRLVPGVDVRARGPQGVQADVLIRGAGFGQTAVLVDGLRLNDAQSGHHNADFPLGLEGIDRIEVVAGAASATHGADAFGGAVHLISRTGKYAAATAAVGSFESARVDAAAGGGPGGLSGELWGSRSDGFMFDRDHGLGGARVSAQPGFGVRLGAAHARKAFGANGFYGASPSKEWTDLTMATAAFGRTHETWTFDARGAYRSHGDRFRWDIARPGFAENVHRTHAADVSARADRLLTGGTRMTLGAAAGGDWIDSSNLGDHQQSRGSVFGEAQVPLGARASLQAALRLDHYSTFGTAASPLVSVSAWPGSRWRVRASAGRAFRAPTYTERFYSDPAHLASADLEAEDGWTFDAGADVYARGFVAGGTVFQRRDRNVIDWVRATAIDRWQTTNVHDVATSGFDLHGTRHFARGFARVTYALLDTDAPSHTLLSKYVLDYTRHAIGAQAVADLGRGISLAVRVDHRRRSDAQRYTLADVKTSARFGRALVFIEGFNLLDEDYTEVAGVAMPGRSAAVGISVR